MAFITQKTSPALTDHAESLPRRRRVGPDLDLDLHPEREAGDPDSAQDGLVVRHVPSHVLDKVPDGLFRDISVVQLHGVDMLPARAGQAEGVRHVVEGPVNLLDDVCLNLAGLAVPAA